MDEANLRERRLCARCTGNKRWYPTSVANLSDFLSPHIKKSGAVPNGYAIRKNVCYGIQYLQYLCATFEQLSLSDVLLTMTFKQFIVSGIGVIEGVLFYELKARSLHRTNEWELLRESSSPITEVAGEHIRIDTRVLRKLSAPADEELTFDRILRIAEQKKVLGTDSKFYAQTHHLRKLRNKVHLYVTAHDLDSDFNAFAFKDFELMKAVLLALFSGQPFAPDTAQQMYFAFLAPWKSLGEQ